MFILLGVVCAPLLLSALSSIFQSGQDLFPWGDHGGLVVETIDAEHGRQLVGTYSRFGWYHPNPVFFYLLAPLFFVLGKNPAGMSATMALINAGAVALLVAIAYRRGGRTAALVAGIGAAILLARIGAETLRDYWVPFSVIIPFAALAFACASVAVGDFILLPLVLALGTFVAGNDLSCTPVVTALTVSAVVFGLIARRRARGRLPALSRRQIVVTVAGSIAVLAILWALPIYDEVHNQPGNISQIRAFFDAGPGEHTAGEGMASLAFVLKEYLWLPGKAFEPAGATPFAMLVVLVVLALLAVAVVIGIVRGRRFGTALAGLSLIALAAEMYAVPNIRGPIYGYLVEWLIGIGPALVAGLALTLGPELQTTSLRRVPLVPALAGVLGLLVAVNLVQLARNVPLKDDAIYAHSTFLKPLYAKLDTWVRAEEVRQPFVSVGTGIEWFDGAAIASKRARDGGEFTIGGPPQGAFGKTHLPGKNQEDADIWIRGEQEPVPKEFELIWRANGISVMVHRRPRN